VARVNDVVIKIATVNGTGSASANGLLMKSIFRMGIPVVGKNYFPSNIQGLPTWYEIRVTGDSYQARSRCHGGHERANLCSGPCRRSAGRLADL
jgi:2-oxoglutarate ferredoxin oxidoreductase subunit alpha